MLWHSTLSTTIPPPRNLLPIQDLPVVFSKKKKVFLRGSAQLCAGGEALLDDSA